MSIERAVKKSSWWRKADLSGPQSSLAEKVMNNELVRQQTKHLRALQKAMDRISSKQEVTR
jgi:hypothetical protein